VTCAYASTNPIGFPNHSNRAPFGVGVVANACGFDVAAASAADAAAQVVRR
jgi:hypothetical protein